MYKTYDDVKLENKFAPMPIQIDICREPKEAMSKVKKVTKALRSGFTKTYAAYFTTSLIGYFVPVWLAKLTGENLTLPFTLTFSNTPGILKTIQYKGVTTEGMFTTFITAGKCAISVAILSYTANI